MNAESLRRPMPLQELAPVPIWIPATWGIGLDFFSSTCDMDGEESREESRRGFCTGIYVPPKTACLDDKALEEELLKLLDMDVLEMENSMDFSTGGPAFELEDTCLELLGLPQDMTNLFEELEAGACEADSDSDSQDEDEDEDEQGPPKRARAEVLEC